MWREKEAFSKKLRGKKGMKKKVLVLTLALVLALASTAMAAVSFSGDFKATYSMTSFRFGQKPYMFDYELNFNVKASSDDVTVVGEGDEAESKTNWEFSGAVNAGHGLGKYKLTLNDQWFTANVWGNGQELSDKATYFDMIKAGKAANQMRARVEVPVVDMATVTLDFDQPNNLRTFVEAEVSGFDIGVAYARKNWSTDDEGKVTADNVVVVQAGTKIDAGGVSIAPKAAVGLDIKEDFGMAFGVSADVGLSDELSIAASVTNANEKWAKGDALTAKNTVLSGTVTWADAALKASATVKQTLVKDDKDKNTNVIDLDAWYRFSDKLDYADLFKADKWYTNDALAIHAFADLTNAKLGEVGVEAASPVMENIWVKGFAKYGLYKATPDATGAVVEDKGFKVGADGYIVVTPKLTVTPFVSFESLGKFLTAGTGASYKIGLSDTTIDLTLKRVQPFDDDYKKQVSSTVSASIKVPF
jgi:hypothetical protein